MGVFRLITAFVVLCYSGSLTDPVKTEAFCYNHCKTPDCTECNLGWFGKRCEEFCPTTCYNGCNKTGFCNGCELNVYGPKCEKDCPEHCRPSTGNDVSCDEISGECLADFLEGWWGWLCNDTCTHCLGNICTQANGECLKRCEPGMIWNSTERKCMLNILSIFTSTEYNEKDTQLSCRENFYGKDCDLKCSSSCLNSSCSFNRARNNVVCNHGCVDGRMGPYCEERCPSGCETCDGSDSSCRNERSSARPCEFACRTSECLECLDGFFGADSCRKRCPANCEGTCHKITGHCDFACKVGHWGLDCSVSCPHKCHNGCNKTTGHCNGGCLAGSHGWRCTEECPIGCLDDVCYQDTGICSRGCFDGYTGEFCNISCEKKCLSCSFKPSICNSCSCNHHGDNCEQQCSVGCLNTTCPACNLQGSCNNGCMEGWWGNKCDRSCPEGCIRCDENTGRCIECQPGKYDYDCKSSCGHCEDKICYVGSGVCVHGCEHGFRGHKCIMPSMQATFKTVVMVIVEIALLLCPIVLNFFS